jgi:hypothetical protein
MAITEMAIEREISRIPVEADKLSSENQQGEILLVLH